MASHKGSHLGSFAKGFSDSLLAVMRMSMMMDYYKSREQYLADHERHWKAMEEIARMKAGKGMGMDPDTKAAYNRSASGWGGGGDGGRYVEPAGDEMARAGQYSDWLQGQGYTKAGAAAILGNWHQENNLRGGGWGGDKGTSAGGFQWHDDPSKGLYRGTGFMNWANENNLDVHDPMTSLKYLVHDLGANFKGLDGQLRQSNNVEALTTAFQNNFEGPKAQYANYANRIGFANAVLGAAPTREADKPTKTATAEEATTDSRGDFVLPGETRQQTENERLNRESPAPPPGSALTAPPDTPEAWPTELSKSYGGHSTNYGPPKPPAIPIGGGAGNVLEAPSPAIPPAPPHTPTPPGLGFAGPQPARPVTPTPYVLPPQMGPEGVSRSNSRVADINAPVVGGDERLQPAENADAPAPNAQTVSAPAGGPAIFPTPRVTSDPRFTQIDRPDVDPTQRSRMGNPQMTALDLSHLWGPNPPVAQRQAQPAPAPTPSAQIRYSGRPTPVGQGLNPSGNMVLNQPGQGEPRSVPVPMPPVRPPDLGSDVATASRKGGPIQRFNRGGIPQRPTMKLQGGGAPNTVAWKPTTSPTPYTTFQPAAGQPLPTVQPPLMGSASPPTPGSANATTYAGFQPWGTGLQWLASQPTSQYTNPMMFTGQQISDDLNALPTGQQQWYNEQMANKMAQGTGQWYYNPASLPAAPAAATATPAATAPAPTIISPPSVQNITNLPSSTDSTATGISNVPNIVTAKSYDPNVDAQTGAGFANTANTGGTNYSVGSNDLLQQNNQGQISGVRKGGAIPSRPAMKYAAAGAVSPNPVIAAMYAGTYTGPGSEGSWVGTPYAQLAPNQQAWADQQKNIWGQINAAGAQDAAYWSGGGTSMTGPIDTAQLANQLSLMPGAIWPTASAAPTPLNEPPPSAQNITAPQVDVTGLDPTTTTTTGTPGVPNIVQAKSYDPNVDQQTGATFANTSNVGGTNYSVGSTDALQTTDQNTITGSRRGGPITPRVRYDDGGGVSPSIAGMPPGLSQQGASPIPPIYFNPATYAGAGAPVGKGVSATSAPTYVAGAIPSLPMFKGGAVRFQGGGDVGAADDMAGMQQVASDDMMDRQADAEDQQELAGMTTPAPAAGTEPSMLTPADFQAQPAASMTPAQQIMPEIHDGQGNPSRGLIGALSTGMHWLAGFLGLGSAQAAQPAIASDPQTQTNRRNFASGQNVGGMDQATYEGFADMQDPHHQLEAGERHIAGLEGAYKWLMSQGREKEAGPLMGSMLQYSVYLSKAYSEQAAKELYDGNLQGAVDNINDAVKAIPDGRNIHAELSKDGKTIVVTGTDITDGRVLWQKYGSAQAILERATAMGRDGKMAWDAIESQVVKYNPEAAQAVKNRQANEIAAGKERADKEAQAQANAQIARFTPTYGDPVQTAPASAPGALPGPGQPPAPVQTAMSPQSAAAGPALPGPGQPSTASPDSAAVTSSTPATQPTQDGSGSAPSHPPPATADSRLDASQAPAPQAQDVDLEHNVAYQNIVANTTPRYFTDDHRPIQGGRPLNPPPIVSEAVMKTYAPQVAAAYREAWQQYNAAVQRNEEALSRDIDGQRRDMALDVQGRRDLQRQTQADTAATNRETAKDALDKSNKVFAANLAGTAPITPQEKNEMIIRGYDPYVGMAVALNPDLQSSLTTDAVKNHAIALNGLVQSGFNASQANILAGAYDHAVDHSHGVASPEEVGMAIQNYISGNHFVFSAEQVDGKGNPVPMHGVVRYNLTVEDNSNPPNLISVRLPERDLAQLRNFRQMYVGKTMDKLGEQMKTTDLAAALGGEGSEGMTAPQYWQGQGAAPGELPF